MSQVAVMQSYKRLGCIFLQAIGLIALVTVAFIATYEFRQWGVRSEEMTKRRISMIQAAEQRAQEIGARPIGKDMREWRVVRIDPIHEGQPNALVGYDFLLESRSPERITPSIDRVRIQVFKKECDPFDHDNNWFSEWRALMVGDVVHLHYVAYSGLLGKEAEEIQSALGLCLMPQLVRSFSELRR